MTSHNRATANMKDLSEYLDTAGAKKLLLDKPSEMIRLVTSSAQIHATLAVAESLRAQQPPPITEQEVLTRFLDSIAIDELRAAVLSDHGRDIVTGVVDVLKQWASQ